MSMENKGQKTVYKQKFEKCRLRSPKKLCENSLPRNKPVWVVNRMYSLCGSFRKEFNKYNETKNKIGSSADNINVHIPSLWYYDQLLLTKEQEMPEKSISNISDDDDNGDESNTEYLSTQINYEKNRDENVTTVQVCFIF